jgi:hypothetical protein
LNLTRNANLRFGQFRQVRTDIELDAIHGAGQGDATNQQHGQQNIGEEGSEVHNLASPFDTLPDAEVAQNPHQQQGAGQLPTDAAHLVDTAGDLQGTTPKESKVLGIFITF